jgi:NAD(P)H-dependent FMN reductase
MTKILAFAGSSRKDSFNKKLLAIAAQGAVSAGAEVTIIDFSDYSAPIFNQDLEMEQGIPDKAREFKNLLIAHDGFLIASPEYNSGFSPLLKNMIDWASRNEGDNEPPLQAYKGKFAVIMATSPGALGGLRGLVFLRMLLNNIGVTVLPEQVAVPLANKAFADDGSLVDEQKQQTVLNLGLILAGMLKATRNK